MSHRIDLVYLAGIEVTPDWQYGSKYQMSAKAFDYVAGLHNVLASSTAQWLLFWDYKLEPPDDELVKNLSEKPVDVWHCGLKLGLGGKPDVINYVDPTWMYNKDAARDVLHSSFRMSLRCALVRREALEKVIQASASYKSLEMYGLALGYLMLRGGGILRYHPGLLSKTHTETVNISIDDEWIFAKSVYPLKWQLWILFNSPRYFKAIVTKNTVANERVGPLIHPSEENTIAVKPQSVSVLAPTLNRYSYLLNELEQLAKQTILPHEVLITDQTSMDERQELDFTKYPNLTVRYFPQDEKGQCIAWNKLLEEATGEYVLFLGDDADDIKPGFIEKLFSTMQRFDADMVASNVIEAGIRYKEINHHYYMSDSFPITLIKRSVLLRSGFMDMFFNRNIRADHDLAMRCHLNGALMIFDPSATIFHHRAPVGGLRAHKARVVTTYMVKNSLTKFINPTSSEIYLVKKYYNDEQYKSSIRIKYFNQLVINGNIFRKGLRFIVFLFKIPTLRKGYKTNLKAAEEALKSVNK